MVVELCIICGNMMDEVLSICVGVVCSVSAYDSHAVM